MVILVDGGSTHNFIQESLASQLGLPFRPTTQLRFMVGNGQYLQCYRVCEVVPIQIHNLIFLVDLHLLPLHGTNLVLGVQWLKSLGPVLMDYNALSMHFVHSRHIGELKSNVDSTLQLLTIPQLHRMLHNKGADAYFHISITPAKLSSTQTVPTPLPLEIQQLLTKFDALFQPPQALPPSRPTNHHIHLLPNSDPVNVRPYRYPHY